MGRLNLKTKMLSHQGFVSQDGESREVAMIETSPAVTLQSSQALLCSYQNLTTVLQIVRVMDGEKLLLERVLWADQALEFWAQPEARLEVFSGEWTHSLMADSIICERLQTSHAAAA